MRKERVVSALGRWESAKKKRGKKPSSNARARLSQSWWRHHFVVHPKHFLDSLLPLFPRRESPKRKRKNGIGILRVGTPPPQRSATTTASFSSSDDHSPRNRFRVPRSRSHRPPPVAFGPRRPIFFFFRSRHHERKRPNTTHLFARRIDGPAVLRPVRERRKPAGRVRSRRFCFSLRKKTYHFSLLCLLLLLLLLLCGGS